MASEIAKAYVQIIPTAQGIGSGISNAMSSEATTAGKKSGESFSSSFGGAVKSSVATIAKVTAGAVASASTAVAGIVKSAVSNFAEYEQLAGGVEKIFADMDTSSIINDAAEAYKDLGLSANQYLATINDVGATFASTMGASEGYETARKGLMAISDYASGTGKNVDLLSEKFMMITRASSSYQSIADQFSGILPATSASFLEQAQSAGILSDQYKKLTEVPINEYQQAVTEMLSKGVEALNLTGNTAAEATGTLSGSITMFKGAWENLLTSIGTGDSDVLGDAIDDIVDSATALGSNLMPVIERSLVGISQMITQLAPEIAGALPNLVSTVLPSLSSAAVQIVMAFGDGLLQSIPSITPVLISLVTQLTELLLSAAPDFLNCGIELIVELANGLTEALPTIIPLATDAIIGLANALTDPNNLETMITAAIDLALALGQGLLEAIPRIIGAIPQIVISIVNALTSPSTLISLIQGVITLINALAVSLPEIITAIVDAIPVIMNTIVEAMTDPTTIAILITGMLQIGVALAAALPQIGESLAMAIPDILGSIVSAWAQLIPALGQVFQQAFSMLTPVAQNALMAMQSIFANIGQFFKDKFLQAANNVKNGFSVAKNYVQQIWEQIKQVFSDVGSKFLSVGQEIVNGIKNGLEGSWENLKSFLSRACGDLIALAKKILGIASPSKEFADQVGQWIPAGIAEGIKDNIGVLDTAINEMSTDMLQTSVNGTMETIQSVNYNPMGPIGTAGESIVINNNIKVDGAQDPEAWTQTFIRTLKREARMA